MMGINNTVLGDYLFVFTLGIAPSCVGVIMVLKTYTKEARRDYFKRFIPTRQGIGFVLIYTLILVFFMTAALILFLGEYPDFSVIKVFFGIRYRYWASFFYVSVWSG